MENNIKLWMFGILGLIPVALGFLFFDYQELNEFKIIRDFGNSSLIAIGLTYFSISILIRLLMYKFLAFFKDINIRNAYKETPFIVMFYTSCVDVFVYGAIPIIITFSFNGDFVNFLLYSLIVWIAIFLYWIIWVFIVKNKKIT